MDSIKKKTAISGIKKVTALLWCFENLTDRMNSVISQDRLRNGTNTNRKRRKLNPESIRLNPKIRSNLAPTKRINGNWVKKIAIFLKKFTFSPMGKIFRNTEQANVSKPSNDVTRVYRVLRQTFRVIVQSRKNRYQEV